MEWLRAPIRWAKRRGAQLILQRTLEMEVDDFLGRGHYEHSATTAVRGWRNGYESRKVQMAEEPKNRKETA